MSWCGVAWLTCCVKCLLTLLINDHVIKRVVFHVYVLSYEGDETIKLHKKLNIVMESTNKPVEELKDPKEEKVINGKRRRGISVWACAYKARNWTLESSKDSSTPKTNDTKTCEPKPTTRTTDA